MTGYVNGKIQMLDEFPSYKGGRTMLHSQGYVFEFLPEHPLANSWGWVAQHRVVGEDIAGRPLIRSKDPDIAECVHHIDEDRTNNNPINLQVMSVREHRRHHARVSADRRKAKLTAEMVTEALEGRTIKDAAALLHCDPMTIRNRFPELIANRKRASPSFADDPETLRQILPYVKSNEHSLKEAAKILKIAVPTILKCCRLHGLEWVHKKRPGRPCSTAACG